MTACEAAHIEFEIELCKNLERDLARYRQRLEGMFWEAPCEEGSEEEKVERKERRRKKRQPTRATGMAGLVACGHDAQEVMDLLHRVLEGRSGVEVPRILKVAQEMGLLLKVPSYEVVQKEFGSIGARNGFYRGVRTHLTDEETKLFSHLLGGDE